jgi:hypothetical protein
MKVRAVRESVARRSGGKRTGESVDLGATALFGDGDEKVVTRSVGAEQSLGKAVDGRANVKPGVTRTAEDLVGWNSGADCELLEEGPVVGE